MAEFVKIPYIITGSFIDEHEIAFTVCYGDFQEAPQSVILITPCTFKQLRSISIDFHGQ